MNRRRATKTKRAELTLGPLLYNWAPGVWRDFYFRIADEAAVDTVVIGEVVCSKREPFIAPHVAKVVERLTAGGKQIVFASLALPTNRREMKAIEELTADESLVIEANDISALSLLGGRPHHVGPLVNVYNEGTLTWLGGRGAVRATLPIELSAKQIAAIAQERGKVELEVFAFGRAPLAVSARCYAARAKGLRKDNCQFVCAGIVDGTDLTTLDGRPFLAVNGTTTMSSAWVNLVTHVGEMREMGIGRFRLSPQGVDMVKAASVFRGVLDGGDPEKARRDLVKLAPAAHFADGFYRGVAGASEIAA